MVRASQNSKEFDDLRGFPRIIVFFEDFRGAEGPREGPREGRRNDTLLEGRYNHASCRRASQLANA